jgi:hypothetical protein
MRYLSTLCSSMMPQNPKEKRKTRLEVADGVEEGLIVGEEEVDQEAEGGVAGCSLLVLSISQFYTVILVDFGSPRRSL